MPQTNTPSAVVDEKIWQAWVEKNKREEEVRSRRMNRLFGVVLFGLAVGAYLALRN